ncbi:MAG: 3-isopropylmalate dehydratase small subunit [Sphingobium sp.]|nr:3-isopropylmalate dehydratase small subunit [Sphingobium sp.]
MKAFTCLTAIAAAYPEDNVDTDKIIPARFLKTISKAGLGAALFNDVRRTASGELRDDFVLNHSPWDRAGILVTGTNFGCGSSREHAPWALADFGIHCIIAASFADIFYNNCLKNGILPVTLDARDLSSVFEAARTPATASITVDLSQRRITIAGAVPISFEIDADAAAMLLEGQDEVTQSLLHEDAIRAFEKKSDLIMAWQPSTLPR